MIYTVFREVTQTVDYYCERILRLCVFQHAENLSFFEKTLTKIYKLFSQGKFTSGFEAARAQRGCAVFANLGADFSFLMNRGNALDVMCLKVERLEYMIQQHGGLWDKFVLRDGQVVIAIKPPDEITENWLTLEHTFTKLGWVKKEGLVITCPFGNTINDQKGLFIQLNSASTSYVMMRKRIGFFLGLKQSVVAFDPPGSGRSGGIASESSYFCAVKTVYERFKEEYSVNKTWVVGACLGAISAAYLRKEIPDINVLLENSFVNLQEDFVKPQGRFNLWFVKKHWKCLFSHQEEKSNFDIETIWNEVSYSDLGKILIINVANDQRVASEVSEKLRSLAARINRNVHKISYVSEQKDPHFSRFEDSVDVTRSAIHYIFSNNTL